jgi:hypothetical protein
MNCPNCGLEMESEQCGLVVNKSLAEYCRDAAIGLTNPDKVIPSVHYYCSGCDSEWTWTRGYQIRCIDGNVPECYFEHRRER